MTYETITTDTDGAVTTITLSRPKVLNALSSAVLEELIDAFAAYQSDDSQLCAILTGAGDKAFAAGADIKEMADKDAADFYLQDFFARWTSDLVATTRKPWLAAVNGFALGGGCELAMMADFIIASENAKFGQPEIKLGVAPGMGGSQRLTRAIGKAKAMEMCLTGRMMDAEEAERSGLVARVVPHGCADGRGNEDRAHDRRNAADGRDRQQGDGQRRLRDDAVAGRRARTPPVPDPHRQRRQGGGDGGVHREAGWGMEGAVNQTSAFLFLAGAAIIFVAIELWWSVRTGKYGLINRHTPQLFRFWEPPKSEVEHFAQVLAIPFGFIMGFGVIFIGLLLI